MLFQSVVLPCQYNSVSTQIPVVQWVYKSYCRDRTRDAFSFPDTLSGGLGGGGLTGGTGGTGGGYKTGMTANYLDCSDSSRTVRTVASISGSSITLSEYYKSRDISIINSKHLHLSGLLFLFQNTHLPTSMYCLLSFSSPALDGISVHLLKVGRSLLDTRIHQSIKQ